MEGIDLLDFLQWMNTEGISSEWVTTKGFMPFEERTKWHIYIRGTVTTEQLIELYKDYKNPERKFRNRAGMR